MYFQILHFFFILFGNVSVNVNPVDWLQLDDGLFWDRALLQIIFSLLGLFPLFEQFIHGLPELLQILFALDQLPRVGDIEVRHELSHVHEEGVAFFVDGVDLDDWLLDRNA